MEGSVPGLSGPMKQDFPAILGIRHHGPGSARSVRHALEALQPDAILVEGPPDADGMLSLTVHGEMRPPVALLIYRPETPRQGAYFPFAEFSPEWQAIRYGLQQGVPVRFMDLPQAQRLALEAEGDDERTEESPASFAQSPLRQDPLSWVAEATGHGDGERWWEQMIEQRRDSTGLFQGILELMTALRQQAGEPPELLEARREAAMRRTLRAVHRAGFRRVAVVCGAWHGPALADPGSAKADDELLKGLPRVKVTATWVPWTYGRLCYRSGYGAGIEAPGFYHHLWTAPADSGARWLARVAQLLRAHDLAASTAGVIEAARLAESLAVMRGRPLPNLTDLNEAARTVFCFGDAAPLDLIHDQLCVGERLGQVPEETPRLPLQQDLQRLQKRLRLPPEADQRLLELDLRKPTDLERSHLLHRLDLLAIPWGQPQQARGKGTFKEHWRLRWQPELAVAVIEANVWGNTVADAAGAYAEDQARRSEELSSLTRLVERILLADLPAAIARIMARLHNVAATTSDIPQLMEALPPLVNVLRYGNVRQTDTAMVNHVVEGWVIRICIGLPAACTALNDEAAQAMFERLVTVHGATALLPEDALRERWRAVLLRLAEQENLHGLLAGRCCRLLFEQQVWSVEQTARRMGLALSPAVEPRGAAAWIEGFLQGSGLLLLHNEGLWQILDTWVMSLTGETFERLLPLLRRTFATFPAPQRRQMGESVRRGVAIPPAGGDMAVDTARADRVLPLVARLLGLNDEEQR